NSAQLSLFKDTDFAENLPEQERFGTFDQFEKIQMDYHAFSVSTHGHPMGELRKSLTQLPKCNSSQMKKQNHGAQVTVSGLILFRQKPPTAKGVCFATMEDEF